jgi:hypothetical protein
LRSSLQELYCRNNKLETLKGLEQCVNLHRNSKNFQLGNFVSLQYLDCDSNQLETLEGLEKCAILQKLHCYYNKLTTLKGIEQCVNLILVSCVNNQLGEIENNIKNMINGKQYKITEESLKFSKLYSLITVDEMNIYYNYMSNREKILVEYNYNNFIRSQYFKDHKIEIVEEYNLVGYYDELYLKYQTTEEECSICIDDTFELYIRCVNGHVICKECYELCQNKKECCVCRVEYDIKDMFYSKS